MNQDKKQRLLRRSNGVCELCQEAAVETIYSLLRKGQPEENDPTYSCLCLCKKCAATLKRGSTVKTSKSIKLVIFNNKNKDIQIFDGKTTNKAIDAQVKGNYIIAGPYLMTDIMDKNTLSFVLSKKG